MRELSIAESIVSIADRHAGGRRVVKVEMKVGHLRQVVPSALEFAFRLVAQGTAVEGADLELEESPRRACAGAAGGGAPLAAFPFTCPGCGGMDLQVTQGEELLVDSLELERAVRRAEGEMEATAAQELGSPHLWISEGMSCGRDSVSVTAAGSPGSRTRTARSDPEFPR